MERGNQDLQVRSLAILLGWSRQASWVGNVSVNPRRKEGGGIQVYVQSLSRVRLFCNPVDYIACQAPLFMGFSRQEHRSGLPFPSPGHLSDPGIEPGTSSALQADSLLLNYWGTAIGIWGNSSPSSGKQPGQRIWGQGFICSRNSKGST